MKWFGVAPTLYCAKLAMPGLSGLDVAKELRSVCKDRKLLLVATTGHGRPEDQAVAKAAGFDCHLTKPIEFSRLEEVLTQAH